MGHVDDYYELFVQRFGQIEFGFETYDQPNLTIGPQVKHDSGSIHGYHSLAELFEQWVRLVNDNYPVGTKAIAIPLVDSQVSDFELLKEFPLETLEALQEEARHDYRAFKKVIQVFIDHQERLRRIMWRYGAAIREVKEREKVRVALEKRKKNAAKRTDPNAKFLDEVLTQVREGNITDWQWFSSGNTELKDVRVRILFRPPDDFWQEEGKVLLTPEGKRENHTRLMKDYIVRAHQHDKQDYFNLEWTSAYGDRGGFRHRVTNFEYLWTFVTAFDGKPEAQAFVTYAKSGRSTTLDIHKIWGVPYSEKD